MIFANDRIFYLFFLIVPIFYLFMRDEKIRRKRLLQWVNFKILPGLTGTLSASKRLTRKIIELVCFVFILTALARPLAGKKEEHVKRKGVDVVIALDVSSSMLAEDYPPSRLQKAKQELRGLLNHIEGHRIGLVAFAGYAAVLCPITTDTATLQTYLDVLDTQLFNYQGTAIKDAIEKSVKLFDKRNSHGKAIVLITDGENHQENPMKAAENARQAGIHIYCIGIGSETGEPIPIYNEAGEKSGHKRDEKGEVILTKLDENTLSQISNITGGKYFRASLNEIEIDRIFKEISHLEKGEFGEQNLMRYDELFQVPLMWAFLGLLWAEILGTKPGILNKLFSKIFRIFYKRPVKAMLVFIAIFLQFGFGKSRTMEEANKFYSEKKYTEAAQKYEDLLKSKPQNPEIHFNLGNTLYQNKNYSDAQKQYTNAENGQKRDMTAKSEYSIGNCYFRQNQFDQALTRYKKAMEIDPNDMDAKYNYEITLRKIKENKQKQEEQKKQQEKKDKEQKEKEQQKPSKSDQEEQKDQNKSSGKENQKQNKSESSSKKDQKPKNSSDQDEEKKEDSKPGQEKHKQKKEENGKTSKPGEEKKETSDKTQQDSASTSQKKENKKDGEKNNSPAKAKPQDSGEKKKGNEMTRQEALELLEAGHNDKKDLLYNLLRSQQHQNSSKEGKDW